ncbi:hypothetical protein BV25DRAFT_397964 [Artomyces pyxidatus]|uniref:Uncharacterized protein n=1 Tax=Artomyces pyxidatus TaxID=48021 RepID=A0ACB8T655_9AGAM|nr:hypothetical protein BV25DRAFT_397964 [Artomyces pyxidatus]
MHDACWKAQAQGLKLEARLDSRGTASARARNGACVRVAAVGGGGAAVGIADLVVLLLIGLGAGVECHWVRWQWTLWCSVGTAACERRLAGSPEDTDVYWCVRRRCEPESQRLCVCWCMCVVFAPHRRAGVSRAADLDFKIPEGCRAEAQNSRCLADVSARCSRPDHPTPTAVTYALD